MPSTVATELCSDVAFVVEGLTYHLHKYPLLCKCARLQRLIAENHGSLADEINIQDIPGGGDTFELCAKFCYGIVITLNAFNVMAVRCAAEYLEMTEAMEKGNLVFKIEVFLNSSMFRSWKDSIIGLQSTKMLLPWAEDLKMISRCIDSIASKTSVDPTKVDWSFTHTRSTTSSKQQISAGHSPLWNGIHSGRNKKEVPQDWWVEDICELDVDLYWRVMLAVKSKGRMGHELIGEALRVYAYKWLPGVSKDQNLVETVRGGTGILGDDHVEMAAKHRLLLETIVSLLPSERAASSCGFLLKLLKAATILGAASASKMELARRIGLQLEEASLNDLLIPSLSYASDCLYDVDLVQCILEHFLMQDQSPPLSPNRAYRVHERRRTRSTEQLDFVESCRSTSTTHSSKLRVAKLIDGYLAEVSRDANLMLFKFIALAEMIPDFARPVHDGLYRAIDIYLKEHPGLSKSEKKKICRLMDCKKLSMDACMHAAQNDRLPLRVVVQVLFFEQVRTAMSGGFLMNDLPSNIKTLLPGEESQHERLRSAVSADDWEAVQQDFTALQGDLDNMKKRIAEAERQETTMRHKVVKQSSSMRLFFHPKKFFSKLWSSINLSVGKASVSTRSCGSATSHLQEKHTGPRRCHSVS